MTDIKGIVGEKVGMTQIFVETRAVPVTVIKAGPCVVTQIRTQATDGYTEGAFDAVLEPGNMLCVEALVSPEGGDFSIKLEDQVLITETGCENLTAYPFDPALIGAADFRR